MGYLHVLCQLNRFEQIACQNGEHKMYLLKNSKMHKFATCNLDMENRLLSDMHCLIADILAEFKFNQHSRLVQTVNTNVFERKR